MRIVVWFVPLVFLLQARDSSCWRSDRRWRFSNGLFDRLFNHRWFDVDQTRISFDRSDKQWWNGENVCVSLDVKPADDWQAVSTRRMVQTVVCDVSDTMFRCTTSKPTSSGRVISTETYECCTGYTRKPTDQGCTQVLPLEDVPTKLESLQLENLVYLGQETGLFREMGQEALNFTVFAPTDSGLSATTDQLRSGLKRVSKMKDGYTSRKLSTKLLLDTKNVILGHVHLGRIWTTHMDDEQIIETTGRDKTTIRINKYRQPLNIMTANCKKIINPDNMASNGVVHVVENELNPVTRDEHLLELVSRRDELSALKTVLGRSSLATILRNSEGHVTLLAPTNYAIKKNTARLKKILYDGKCVDNFLKNHILMNVICSSAIQGNAKTPNMLSKFTNVSRNTDGKLFANDAQIVEVDSMATNGVLHLIDDVLIPDEAVLLLDLAQQLGLTKFIGLVKQANLRKELNNAENITIFIPSNEAVQNMADMTPEMLTNQIRYHVVPEVLSCNRLRNNEQLDTSHKDARLRFHEYPTLPFRRRWTQTIQCAPVQPLRINGCNGVFYVIDKVLVPPVGNVLDVLSRDRRFSILVQLLKLVNLSDSIQTDGSFTIFAPTNEVFENMDKGVFNQLISDTEALRDRLLDHVASGFVCCAGIFREHWTHVQKIRTLSGTAYPISRNRANTVIIDNLNIVACDVTATNGVVHVIDGLLSR